MYFYIFQFFIVVFLSCILSYLGVRTKKGTPIVLLLFCIIAIAIGTRVNIGGDYRNYCQIIPFLNDSDFGFGNRFSIEYGFALICKIGKFLGNDVFWFFFLSALITVYLFFNLYREQKILLPVGIFIFFLSLPFGFVINGVRQGVAIFAFLNAITSASKQESISFKGFIVYLFWIILGASFHSATLVFIPVYFLTGEKILNLFNWWILVVIALSGFWSGYAQTFPSGHPGLIEYSRGVVLAAVHMAMQVVCVWKWTSPLYLILLYLLFCITSEITLSPTDLAGMWRGVFILVFFIILLNLIPGVNWVAFKLSDWLAPALFVVHSVLVFVLLIDAAFYVVFRVLRKLF